MAVVVLVVETKTVAVTPPKVTVYGAIRLVPVSVTVVRAVPVTGESALSVGAATVAVTYVKLAGKVALPPGVNTVTSTTPGACAGVRAVTAVLLTGARSVADKPPKVTA